MPTGYTADVQSGKITEFRDFAMQCARAFGALITMRDDPHDAPIPDELSASTDYYDKSVAAAEEVIAEVSALAYGDCITRANAEYEKELAAHAERAARRAMERARYEAMLAKVLAWPPPTPDHAEMKSFMIEQLTQSIDFDCSGKYDDPPKRLTGDEWREQTLRTAERNLAYGREHREQEITRTNGRNEWLRALRASLSQKPGN